MAGLFNEEGGRIVIAGCWLLMAGYWILNAQLVQLVVGWLAARSSHQHPASNSQHFSHHLNENVEHFNQVMDRRKQARAVAAEEAAAASEVSDEVGE